MYAFWNSKDLSFDEKLHFEKINKNNRLVNAIKQAQLDFDSGNCMTFNSFEEYAAYILKNAIKQLVKTTN